MVSALVPIDDLLNKLDLENSAAPCMEIGLEFACQGMVFQAALG